MKRSWIRSGSLCLIFALAIGCRARPESQAGGTGTTPTPTPGPTPMPAPEYCAQAPHDQPCPFVPHDVTVSLQAGYSQLSPQDQRPFDNFSWQLFLALNWPADAQGNPLPGPINANPEAPRVWMFYPTPQDVFHLDFPGGLSAHPAACEGVGDRPGLPVFQLTAKNDHAIHGGSDVEATGQALIDRNLNFTLFDIRLNPTEAEYIRSQGLESLGGQVQFKAAGKTVSFPMGSYKDSKLRLGGAVGAIEIKTAWRILDPAKGDKPERFYTTPGLVYVHADNSESGKPFCFQANLGLVGFHAIERTTGPAGQEQDWMWGTFEHVDNAPEALDPADPTSKEAAPTNNCTAPPRAPDIYSYYQATCSGPGCTPNTAPTAEPNGHYLWATKPPYARRYANGTNKNFGTQVVRCWKIYSETEALNDAFRKKLAGTVWANYRLINTQWQAHQDSPEVVGQTPMFLSNPVQETYIQSNATCLGCHGTATTSVGQNANFSFLLSIPRLFAGKEGTAATPAPGGK